MKGRKYLISVSIALVAMLMFSGIASAAVSTVYLKDNPSHSGILKVNYDDVFMAYLFDPTSPITSVWASSGIAGVNADGRVIDYDNYYMAVLFEGYSGTMEEYAIGANSSLVKVAENVKVVSDTGSVGSPSANSEKPAYINSFTADNLNTSSTDQLVWDLSEKTVEQRIGSVTLTYDEDIDQSSIDQGEVRVYFTGGVLANLTSDAKDNIKTLLFNKFKQSGNALGNTIYSDYATLVEMVNAVVDEDDLTQVESIQLEVLDFEGNIGTIKLILN